VWSAQKSGAVSLQARLNIESLEEHAAFDIK
jgi:hypothetical protein